MPVTINDVARKCKVSPMTISRVLNHTGPVKEATRQKVLETVRQLNYRPLRRPSPNGAVGVKSIGLVVPIRNLGNSPFYSRFVVAAKNASEDAGYTCILYSEDEVVRKATAEHHLGRQNLACDALVSFCPYAEWDRYLSAAAGWGIRGVLIRRRTGVPGVAVIDNDDAAGVKRALQYLADRGHRAIGYVGRINSLNIANRFLAYRDFIREQGLVADERFVVETLDRRNPQFGTWLKEMLELPVRPTAFFCYDDNLAAQFVAEVQTRGFKVPADFSVVGHDDDDICGLLRPPLTTVRIDVERMARLAVQIVSGDMIRGDIGRLEFEVKNELVERESCGSNKTS